MNFKQWLALQAFRASFIYSLLYLHTRYGEFGECLGAANRLYTPPNPANSMLALTVVSALQMNKNVAPLLLHVLANNVSKTAKTDPHFCSAFPVFGVTGKHIASVLVVANRYYTPPNPA